MKYLLVLCAFVFTSCSQGQDLVVFPQEALNDVFLAQDGAEVKFEELLDKYKGKTIFIDLWASWCRDCIKAMPKVNVLQEEFKDVVFVFLSLDKTARAWERGIKKYNVKGAHYFISKGWKSPFCDAIDLDWIPRYMVVNSSAEISVYRAIETGDFRLQNALESTNISEKK
jgi:thiol-disulfide isomerase/thioredoxin